MKVNVYRQWEIRNRDGKLIRRTRKKMCRSYVLAFADLLAAQMTNASQSIPDIANASQTQTGANAQLNTQSTADHTWGLVVGTGTNAVALSDYGLQTIIADGTSAGQLQYGQGSYTNPITTGSTRQFTLIMTLTNNSGGSITVNETGIYVKTASNFKFCVERSLESPGVAIADTATGTLTYTIGVTV